MASSTNTTTPQLSIKVDSGNGNISATSSVVTPRMQFSSNNNTNALTPTTTIKGSSIQAMSAIPVANPNININPRKLLDVLKIKKRPVSTCDSDDLQWYFKNLKIEIVPLTFFFYLTSPICYDVISVAQVTKCGHSFW